MKILNFLLFFEKSILITFHICIIGRQSIQTRDKVFQAPPVEWTETRLAQLRDILDKNTAQSAQALRQVLGPIEMEVTYPEIGRPYYVAHSSIQTLAIIDKPTNAEYGSKGSSVLRWWAWKESIRTLDNMPLELVFTK